MKKFSLIAFIGAVFLLCVFLFISSCKKEDKEEENVNQIPTCTITNPLEGQQIAKGEIVIVSVEAKDTDGTINEVQFAIDGTDRGSAVSFPYNYSWITSNVALGVHTIKATAIDNAGTEKTDQVTVEIIEDGGDIPLAAFTGNPTSGTAPLTVNFTDQSANNPTSWQWNFGDGGSSTQQNPAHTFNSAGNYTVELVASNTYGSDAEVKNNYIIVTTGGGTGQPCPGIPTITYQGQTYNTVLIGSQCWMKENLNVGTRINNSQEQTDNGTIEKYCWDNNEANCDEYGGLYQWDEMMQYMTQQGVQGICPDGWHVPGDAEWDIMVNYLGGEYVAGGKMKEAGYAHWNSPNTGATNESGFTALPGGRRTTGGSFYARGSGGYWWSSTESSSSYAWSRSLIYSYGGVLRYGNGKTDGFSLRCLKD